MREGFRGKEVLKCKPARGYGELRPWRIPLVVLEIVGAVGRWQRRQGRLAACHDLFLQVRLETADASTLSPALLSIGDIVILLLCIS